MVDQEAGPRVVLGVSLEEQEAGQAEEALPSVDLACVEEAEVLPLVLPHQASGEAQAGYHQVHRPHHQSPQYQCTPLPLLPPPPRLGQTALWVKMQVVYKYVPTI